MPAETSKQAAHEKPKAQPAPMAPSVPQQAKKPEPEKKVIEEIPIIITQPKPKRQSLFSRILSIFGK